MIWTNSRHDGHDSFGKQLTGTAQIICVSISHVPVVPLYSDGVAAAAAAALRMRGPYFISC